MDLTTPDDEPVISRDQAVRLIENLLRSEERQYARHNPPITLAITTVSEHRLGWIVHWQSEAFIRSGNFRDQLIGAGPYLVDRDDGSIHLIPGTDYLAGLWEEDYEQRVKPHNTRQHDPWADVPFATEIRETLQREGRVEAIRLLRQRAPRIHLPQAFDYVTALGAGQRPADELIELARPAEPFTPRLGITTITGPNRPS